MPKFETGPEYMDIDPSDFFYNCNKEEINELIQCLIDDGYIPNVNIIDVRETKEDEIFNNQVLSLVGNRYKLTKDEESTILKICEGLK